MSACYCDYEPATIWDETWRRARKTHKCCECGSGIKPGNLYQIVASLYEGRWDHYKTCEPCADLRDALNAVSCPLMLGLDESYYDHLSYTNSDAAESYTGLSSLHERRTS